MSSYLYCIKEDYRYRTAITGHTFENEWFCLDEDGTVIIKGSYKQGYAWDGCSPKVKLFDIYCGTPEAVLNVKTGKSKTYYASLVHDVLYQFSKDVKPFMKRKAVDQEFYVLLKASNFKLARIYYSAVRAFGWLFW